MFKYIKTIITTITVFIFLALAFGSGDSDEKVVINISDKQALEKYIQGKWSWKKHTGDVNMTWRYRFEIIGNTLRIWKCVSNTEDPFDMSEGYEELHFSLGEPTRDVDGYNARYLEFAVFDKTNFFGLTYENLAPFWLVSDDNWDTPVLRCASGIPSWSREEFQTTGNKITHSDSYSNNEETYNESDYSNSSSDYSEETQTMENNEQINSVEYYNTNSQDELTNEEFSSNQIIRNPDPRKDFANVFWKKKYTLFDFTTDEPIFPSNQDGIMIYKIYYSNNEDPNPYYGEFTNEQLERHPYYKFKNKVNCMKFCNSKR